MNNANPLHTSPQKVKKNIALELSIEASETRAPWLRSTAGLGMTIKFSGQIGKGKTGMRFTTQGSDGVIRKLWCGWKKAMWKRQGEGKGEKQYGSAGEGFWKHVKR
jgi:hypothetical protein